MILKSQQVRSLSPEMDPLRMGMGWTVDDLSKPQIMVESTYGNSHPGSGHLNIFVEEAVRGVNDHGGKAARYFATDMCDGMAQGHDGINYSLAHREAITNLVEAQANATTFDGGVFISSCDKAMPAMLMSIGRMKDMMAAIVVTGGVMEAYDLPAKYTENDPGCAINELLTLEQIGKFSAQYERGEIPAEQLTYYKQHACPSCGACSFMGTASTMQVMAEALGLMLPGTALMPATAPELKQAAYDAGVQVMKLVAEGIKADIPDEMIEMQAHQMLEGFKQQLASQGIPFDQYTKMTGMNEEQIIMDAKEPATNQVRMDLAIRAIIKAENLEVSDEEVENEMKSVAEKYGMDLDTVKKYLRAEDVKEQVMREKVIKVVADSATAVAPEVKEEETKTEEEEEKKD